MKPKPALYALLLTALLSPPPLLAAEEPLPLPDDPTQAWAELQNVHQALRPPSEWRTQAPSPDQLAAFQKQLIPTAVSFAARAMEFVQRFPTNENVGDARILAVYALTHAVAAGDTGAEKQIGDFVSKVQANQSLPEDDRVGITLYGGNASFMKKVGMRWFTEGMSKLQDEFETASIDNMHAVLQQYPTNTLLFTMLVSFAQRATGDRREHLATEVLEAPGAPPGAKSLAKHILDGTKPYQIGQPLDIQFTALDGREVDLSKLTGKVVLVEFWSTTCGPCIGEMPTVKATFEKLHDQGFEIVAISLDDKETALRRFIKENELPWPQHFDGKGWGNKFAVRYGVFSIPTMWLVDKHGHLQDTEARFNLEQKITKLLAE